MKLTQEQGLLLKSTAQNKYGSITEFIKAFNLAVKSDSTIDKVTAERNLIVNSNTGKPNTSLMSRIIRGGQNLTDYQIEKFNEMLGIYLKIEVYKNKDGVKNGLDSRSINVFGIGDRDKFEFYRKKMSEVSSKYVYIDNTLRFITDSHILGTFLKVKEFADIELYILNPFGEVFASKKAFMKKNTRTTMDEVDNFLSILEELNKLDYFDSKRISVCFFDFYISCSYDVFDREEITVFPFLVDNFDKDLPTISISKENELFKFFEWEVKQIAAFALNNGILLNREDLENTDILISKLKKKL